MLKRFILALAVVSSTASAQQPAPVLSPQVIDALARNLSGERALETIKAISANHRTRGSRPFRGAAELIAARARGGGLDDVKIEEFPADGKIFYGTQRSRPPWDAEFAELWEMKRDGPQLRSARLITSWAKQPMSVAEDSESGDVTAELVDVGAGAAESDYAGKNVKGKLILVSSQPADAVPLGVAKFGARGIVSYAQNQKTGWWGENTDLVRWGHLDTFSPTKTFSFMVSPRVAKAFSTRLARREHITMHAVVRAGQHPGAYSVVTAAIRGADEKLSQQEIVFSCHLDHPNPGANDNASGCATILEVGVTLSKLIKTGTIPRPARTIRFVWPPEVEGTMAMLNSKPEWAKRIRAVVHMDMVGAGPTNKSVFHVGGGPASLPSFVYEVAQSLGAWVNDATYKYAATGQSAYPLVAPTGGKEPLLAQLDEFDMGSDHEVYEDASWRIPAIYLHDWPDRYIHTTWDTPDRIDPTKLLRAGFIGAASGYFLAAMSINDTVQLRRVLNDGSIRERLRANAESVGRSHEEMIDAARFETYRNTEVEKSWRIFLTPQRLLGRAPMFLFATTPAGGDSGYVVVRNPDVRGPISVFGYDYLRDKIGAERYSKLRLLDFNGLRGGGSDYAYEVLNWTYWGLRATDITSFVSTTYGPVPMDLVVEYLKAAEDAGVVTRSNSRLNVHQEPTLRAMSYNIEYGHEGLDSVVNVIRDQQVDLVGLQEVDVHWSERSNFVDQAALVAQRSGMNYKFARIYRIPNVDSTKAPREFGVAILSKYPIVGFINHPITRHSTQDSTATAAPLPGFLEATLDLGRKRVRVFNVHLDYRSDPSVRITQVNEMLGYMTRDTIPTILMGDMNAPPDAAEIQPLFHRLRDVWPVSNGPGLTDPAKSPRKRIDYIMASDCFHVLSVSVPEVYASDHRPVVASLALDEPCSRLQ
ncbi:MAG: endonuclease/exonuclease/phosphatase family protein [Gemmatimonadaceae bacterium]